MNFIKVVFAFFMVCILSIFISCGKDEVVVNYPKTVTITYKITGTLPKGDVTFTNETGGITNLTDQAMPFTKQFSTTVKQFDVKSINFSSPVGGTQKIEILVDDKVVKTETFVSNSVISGAVFYQFP
jgi:hypothetical protein